MYLLRDHERGVPGYNEYRCLLYITVPKTFEESTGGHIELAKELSDVCNGNIELFGTLIGTHSENIPADFGFSDVSFGIFILMASRRLKSDPLIASQWSAETYTKEGLNWVQNTGMKDILIRQSFRIERCIEGNLERVRAVGQMYGVREIWRSRNELTKSEVRCDAV